MKDGYADRPSRRDDHDRDDRGDRDDRDDDRPSKPLGSLAQSARGKKLNEARVLLIAVGLLTFVVNIGVFFFLPTLVRQAVDEEIKKQGAGFQVDPVLRAEAEANGVYQGRIIAGCAAFLGAVFIVFGLIVKQFPVPITILALVLYIGANVATALIDPVAVASGIIFKILITIGLVRAVQAAFAYEKQRAEEEDAPRRDRFALGADE